MTYFTGLKCTRCAASYGRGLPAFLCPQCGGLLDPQYDYEALARHFDKAKLSSRDGSIWRWRELLPVEDGAQIVSLGEGGTPLLRCDRLAAAVGVREIYIKNDTLNPTGSLKDRSVAIAATKALEFGYKVLSCDSWGNKAASVAAYAARAGLASVVFCPADTPAPKLVQSLAYGAKVVTVRASFSELKAMYRQLVLEGNLPWYECGSANPFRYEGKKTYGYEISEGLGWEAPDWVVQPAAGGLSTVKAWKGFGELYQLGWIRRRPKMALVQAEACAPIARAFAEGKAKVQPVAAGPTIASALAVGDPGDSGDWALRALRESQGAAVGVSEEEIRWAVQALSAEGVFAEPSAAVTIPAVKRLVAWGIIDESARVVCVVTGSGFKDMAFATGLVAMPEPIELDWAKFEAVAADIERRLGKGL